MSPDEKPRILVIARRDAHHAWEEALGKDNVHCITPLTNVYGMRCDLIIEDSDRPINPDHREKYEQWLEQELGCRLGMNGKFIRSS